MKPTRMATIYDRMSFDKATIIRDYAKSQALDVLEIKLYSDEEMRIKGYDDATCGRDRMFWTNSHYRAGWIEGKKKLVEWANEELNLAISEVG